MSTDYERMLDASGRVELRVEFATKGPEVIDYSLVLIAMKEGEPTTIRVYDGAHGINEMHRYTRSGGKQKAERFHAGTLGEGMRTAIREIKRGHREMIEGWER